MAGRRVKRGSYRGRKSLKTLRGSSKRKTSLKRSFQGGGKF